MSPRAPVLRSATAGVVEATRIFARAGELEAGAAGPADLAQAPLAAGAIQVGPLRATLAVALADAHAVWSVEVANASQRAVHVESVGLGFAWTPPDAGALRFLRQGHQSWSFAGGEALDDAGAPAFPSGPWLRGFHRGTWEAPADRGGWHEVDGVTAAGARSGAITIGALESGLAFGVAYLRRDGARVLAELEQRVERSLEPGESIVLEPVRVALGDAPTPLLEAHADAQGRRAGARSASPFQAGWCSWYHFFHDVTEDAFLRNLDALVAARSEIPIELVQLDDGYQRAIGDWLETNEKFPSGLAAIASAVRAAGFTPGLWTAPFCVVPESRIFETHARMAAARSRAEGPLARPAPREVDAGRLGLRARHHAARRDRAPRARVPDAHRDGLPLPQDRLPVRRSAPRQRSRRAHLARRAPAPRARRRAGRHRRRVLPARLRLSARPRGRAGGRDAHRARHRAVLERRRRRDSRSRGDAAGGAQRAAQHALARLDAPPLLAERSRLPDGALESSRA